MSRFALEALVRRPPLPHGAAADDHPLVEKEWLVTNGLGGYASGTIGNVTTRRYHGVLVAALPNPLGRVVMLNQLAERILREDGSVVRLDGVETAERRLEVNYSSYLRDFRLEAGLPVWVLDVDGIVIEKRVHLVYRQNTAHVSYRLCSGQGGVRLQLQPSVHFRRYEDPVNAVLAEGYELINAGDWYEVVAGAQLPALRLRAWGGAAEFTATSARTSELLYRVEERRGYEFTGVLWTPGYFTAELAPDATITLIASAEPRELAGALSPDEARFAELERRRRLLNLAPPAAREGIAAELVLAADQFIIAPAGRVADAARAYARGDTVRSVIAGYHWFTDWGRDTMISLEGLTLATGRFREAGYILRTFARYVRDGLIPNLFPDGSNEGLYHTADATLWFFHALHRYEQHTGDRLTLVTILPVLIDIVEHHLRGTRYGIAVDPADGLLRQGAEGYQLTWMDAKVEGWVVTPRRGKAVEINALWYNALCLVERWVREERSAANARAYAEQAARVRESFNRRFWYEPGGHLFDVVDGEAGDSPQCRPNQLFAIALDNPVLDRQRWPAVLRAVEERLLTPVGLRSLAPDDPDYKRTYHGDLRTRDAAYHQGTVWGWLIGPWVDAWLKVYPGDLAGARQFLNGLAGHLDDFGVGSIAEIFDAEPPFTPRGCIAQAWSVAEELRCWLKTAASRTE